MQGQLAPIAFSSRLLTAAERRYSVFEKEALAAIVGCEKYRPFLEHKEFTLQTDNQALAWLLKNAKNLGRLGRWVLRLSCFKFRVQHIAGKENVVADGLTRQYEDPLQHKFACLLHKLPEVFTSLQEHQVADNFCREMKAKVEAREPSAKNYKLKQGILVYGVSRGHAGRYVVPEGLRPMILEYYHDSALGAHLGATKTLKRISRVFYWPNQRKDVAEYVRKCLPCQKAKPAQDARVGRHQAQVVTRPSERVFIDFVGPLARSKRGHTAILVVLDGFSKFVALYPVRECTAKEVVEILWKRYFPAFGFPEKVVTDNAAVFRSKLFYDGCFEWGIGQVKTSPYYPQGSQMERFNRNLKAALTIYHHDDQEKWDENLHTLQLAFNTAWHEATGATPALLFLGRELRTPLTIKWQLMEKNLRGKKGMKGFWKEALKQLRKARSKVAARYNRGRKEFAYGVGDLVLYRTHILSAKGKRLMAKMSNKWSGPLVIVKFVTPVTVVLANPETGVIVRKAHVSQVKKYFPRH